MTCARPGCRLDVAPCTRRTTAAQSVLCRQHRHVQQVVESRARRLAAGWVLSAVGSARDYGGDLRGVVLVAAAGARWLLARAGRIVATRGGYASRLAAERVCDERAGR